MVEAHIPRSDVGTAVSLLIKLKATALIHPHTGDGVADHTRFAIWIGKALELDFRVFGPPRLS